MLRVMRVPSIVLSLPTRGMRQFLPATPHFSSSSRNHEVLQDNFGRFHNYLRISLTEKCNLRCVYCMPEEGVLLTPRAKLLALAERKRLITLFAKLGVTKLRFTGGEPTVSNQLKELISHSRNTANGKITNVGITSNGLILKEQLDGLVAAGLTSVNISLDTLIDTKFAAITRRDRKGLFRVLSSVYAAIAKGLPVKINCVLCRGLNDDEVADFVQLTKDVKVDVRFIELMPFDGNEWEPKKFISFYEVIDRLDNQHGVTLKKFHYGQTSYSTSEGQYNTGSNPNSSIKSTGAALIGVAYEDPSDTTKWFKAGNDYAGRVGFITSMSSNFCRSCNRLRITADGDLKVCLFGSDSTNLLQLMRDGLTDEEIVAHLAAAVRGKKAALGGHSSAEEIASHSDNNRPMILIGG